MPDINNALTQVSSEIHVHPDNTNEHVVEEFLDFRGITVVNMDLSNIVEADLMITIQEKVDGINYRIKSFKLYPADFDTDVKTVVITMEGSGNDLKLTVQSTTAEGADRNVPLTLRETVVL